MTSPTLIQRAIERGQITVAPPTPKRRYVIHVQRPAYLNGLPTIAECKEKHICTRCRKAPAIFYRADIGYGAACIDCAEKRRARSRLDYARAKGE